MIADIGTRVELLMQVKREFLDRRASYMHWQDRQNLFRLGVKRRTVSQVNLLLAILMDVEVLAADCVRFASARGLVLEMVGKAVKDVCKGRILSS